MTDAEVVVQNEISIVQIEDADVAVIDRETISIVSEQVQGPAGVDGVDGGGLAAVEDDREPRLGGDLELNGFRVFGSVENNGLTIDGGLIG